MEEPDPVTVRAAQDGDTTAFAVLVRAYQGPVWRYLRHLLADGALAEDVTQETFVRVHRGLRGFDGRSRFSTWVFRVARNAGVDAIRARDRRSRLARQPWPDAVASPELGHELRAALDSIGVDLREAILAVEVLGLSYVEAGQVLGVPSGTVKSRVHRGRERLLRWYQQAEAAE